METQILGLESSACSVGGSRFETLSHGLVPLMGSVGIARLETSVRGSVKLANAPGGAHGATRRCLPWLSLQWKLASFAAPCWTGPFSVAAFRRRPGLAWFSAPGSVLSGADVDRLESQQRGLGLVSCVWPGFADMGEDGILDSSGPPFTRGDRPPRKSRPEAWAVGFGAGGLSSSRPADRGARQKQRVQCNMSQPPSSGHRGKGGVTVQAPLP